MAKWGERISGCSESAIFKALSVITERKQQRLAALASAYLAEADIDTPARIDVITVAVDGHDRVAALAHIENAVET